MPRPECGSVCPPACSLRPGRGRFTRRGVLAVAGNGVVFGVHADRRAGAVRPLRANAVGMPPEPSSTSKPSRAQEVDIPCRRLVFAPGRFAEIEDRLRPGREARPGLVEKGERRFLCGGDHGFFLGRQESSEKASQKVISFRSLRKIRSPLEAVCEFPRPRRCARSTVSPATAASGARPTNCISPAARSATSSACLSANSASACSNASARASRSPPGAGATRTRCARRSSRLATPAQATMPAASADRSASAARRASRRSGCAPTSPRSRKCIPTSRCAS